MGYITTDQRYSPLNKANLNLAAPGAFLQNQDFGLSDNLQEAIDRRDDIKQEPFSPFQKIKFNYAQPWIPQTEEEEEEEEEKKEEPQANNGGGDGLSNQYYGDDATGQDRQPFGWQTWAGLDRGLPNTTGNIFDSFKNAVSNAKIGMSKGLIGVMGNPTMDPGWSRTIDAIENQFGMKAGELRNAINNDFTMPGAKTPQSFADAMKAHALEPTDINRNIDALNKNIEANMKKGMTYAEAIEKVPAELQQALQASKFGNITNSSASMFGRALMDTRYANYSITNTASMQTSPSKMYDMVNGMSSLGYSQQQIDRMMETGVMTDLFGPTGLTNVQQLNFLGALRDAKPGGPIDGYMEHKNKIAAVTDGMSKGEPTGTKGLDSFDLGVAADKAEKEAMSKSTPGVSPDMSWGDIARATDIDTALAGMARSVDRKDKARSEDAPKGPAGGGGGGSGGGGGGGKDENGHNDPGNAGAGTGHEGAW